MSRSSFRRRWPHPAEAEAHLTSELNRGGIDWRDGSRKNVKVNCPFFHEKGPDQKFNMEITRDGRMVHCWVCDWSGSWNKLAKELGLAPFETRSSDTYTKRVAEMDVFGSLLEDFDDIVEDESIETLPKEEELSPWRRPVWRGLKRNFLKKIPTFLWKQQVEFRDRDTDELKSFVVDRVLWPYYQHDRLVGYVGRRLDKSDKMKYFRAPWCHALECFFPFDYVRSNFDCDTIVLVEGEVDALALLQAGIPAMSILGSNNWGDTKKNLLLGLGVSRVVLLMDGDFAGRKAAKEIKKDLDGLVEVLVLKLAEGDDPGAMDEDQLEWLRQRLA